METEATEATQRELAQIEPGDMLKEAIRKDSAANLGMDAPEGTSSAERKKLEDDAVAKEQFDLARDAAMARGEGAAGDNSPFMLYVRGVVRAPRRDPMAALAKLIARDPLWPGTTTRPLTRATSADYFRKMNARPHLLQTLRALWDEYDRHQRREASKTKSRAARAARKQTRAAQKKRR